MPQPHPAAADEPYFPEAASTQPPLPERQEVPGARPAGAELEALGGTTGRELKRAAGLMDRDAGSV